MNVISNASLHQLADTLDVKNSEVNRQMVEEEESDFPTAHTQIGGK